MADKVSFSSLMSDLQSLAKLKTAAQLERRIAALPGEIEAAKRELAARGLLHSGAMLKHVLAICEAATEAQRTTVITEYPWAIGQALFVSQSWVERLVVEATGSLASIHTAAVNHLERACVFVGRPELTARLLSDLEPTEKAAVDDIALALRSCFAERRHGLVRNLPGLITRLVSRLFGGAPV